MFKIGDMVTRISYNHDTVFKIINIKDGVCYLKGAEVRLYADSVLEDLVIYKGSIEDINYKSSNEGDRNDFFYLPAKILHIDGDKDYLLKCLNFYKQAGVFAIGKRITETDVPLRLPSLLKEYKPDIVIITGHDAYYKKRGPLTDIRNYKNSLNFVKSIKVARNYEKSHEKLVIIAGACQSYYEELIKAGANFASSPKRVNIHALDPAIIATTISLTEKNTPIDLVTLLEQTKYGYDGIGGIKCNGLMYVGFPR